MYLALWLISRWRLPATPCLTLPVAVILKRFFTPLLVFSLGIFVSFMGTRSTSPGSPSWPDRQMNHVSVKRAPLSRCGANGKRGGVADLLIMAPGSSRRRTVMEDENLGPASGVAAHLTIRDGRGDEAVKFYESAFGAQEQ